MNGSVFRTGGQPLLNPRTGSGTISGNAIHDENANIQTVLPSIALPSGNREADENCLEPFSPQHRDAVQNISCKNNLKLNRRPTDEFITLKNPVKTSEKIKQAKFRKEGLLPQKGLVEKGKKTLHGNEPQHESLTKKRKKTNGPVQKRNTRIEGLDFEKNSPLFKPNEPYQAWPSEDFDDEALNWDEACLDNDNLADDPWAELNFNDETLKENEACLDNDYLADNHQPQVNFKDETTYPMCESWHRFRDTTHFKNDVNYAGTYSRSKRARYVNGNQKIINFLPTPLTSPIVSRMTNSLYAHTGGYANPYVLPKYSKNITLNPETVSSTRIYGSELYNELVIFRQNLCDYIVNEFRKKKPCVNLGGGMYNAKIVSALQTKKNFKQNEIIILKNKLKTSAPVSLYTVKDGLSQIDISDNQEFMDKLSSLKVRSNRKLAHETLKKFQPYLESKNVKLSTQGVDSPNTYPCVFVEFTPRKKVDEETFYKRYNYLLVSYFIAIVDYNACQAGIPIEIVDRASFGHNDPSVCVTGKSFRINTGLIPKAYADIIVQSLIQLHDLFYLLETTDQHLDIPKKLKDTLESGRTGKFKQKNLPDTFWDALCAKGSEGDTGRIFLHELIERSPDRSALLSNFVLQKMIQHKSAFFADPKIAELPLQEMFELVSYEESKITLNSKEVLEKYQLFSFGGKPAKQVSDDRDLYAIITKISTGLAVELPKDLTLRNLYKFLNASIIDFTNHKRTRPETHLNTLSDWGSDSEVEVDKFANAKSIFGKKLVVANGMLAINLAYYAAKCVIYLVEAAVENRRNHALTIFQKYSDNIEVDQRKMSINADNSYYETISGNPKEPLCLDCATNPPEKKENGKVDILFYDLNSYSSESVDFEIGLRKKLELTQPMVVILDHTSSTTYKIKKAIKMVYEYHPTVCMVLLVTSGLKQEQAGSDKNPHGKLALLSLANNGEKNNLTNFVYDEMTLLRNKGKYSLHTNALLKPAAHAIRHSFKDKGFTTTLNSILSSNKDKVSDSTVDNIEVPNRISADENWSNLDYVLYFLKQKKLVFKLEEIDKKYPKEIDIFQKMGLSDQEIFSLYKQSSDKFLAMADERILRMIEENIDQLSFDKFSDIYDQNKNVFFRILDDCQEADQDADLWYAEKLQQLMIDSVHEKRIKKDFFKFEVDYWYEEEAIGMAIDSEYENAPKIRLDDSGLETFLSDYTYRSDADREFAGL